MTVKVVRGDVVAPALVWPRETILEEYYWAKWFRWGRVPSNVGSLQPTLTLHQMERQFQRQRKPVDAFLLSTAPFSSAMC